MKNAKFHKNEQGRKIQTSELLGGATPPFKFHKIQLEKASRFGVVHLPSPDAIRLVAQELKGTSHSARATKIKWRDGELRQQQGVRVWPAQDISG
ncbi:hypothetical protein [Nonomuraea maritima]|uniref:hypothetical protein n=1 Tax=Nonomuraea maritima TaxID=683260 RepID=UPI00115F9CEE|nr:hypothetical protein [Nonomuraea maritima]